MIVYKTEINSENFEEKLSNNDILLLYITATWCAPCRTLGPIIDEVSNEIGDKLLIGKLDAEQNSDLTSTLNVRNIPTLILYKNGNQVERTTGIKSKGDIIEMVTKYIETVDQDF